MTEIMTFLIFKICNFVKNDAINLLMQEEEERMIQPIKTDNVMKTAMCARGKMKSADFTENLRSVTRR